MASFSAWYDAVLAQVAGCPSALADWAILDAAIDFCERSHAHIADLTAINSVAATADYTLTAPTLTEIIKVLAVEYDGEEIRPIGPRDIARRYGTDWQDLSSTPERYMTQYGTSLKLIPMPAAAVTGGIVVTVVLKPTGAATTINDTIATPYKRAIAMGARARLWLMPKKPWTNFDRGKKEEDDFIIACAVAHSQSMKGRTSAPMRSRNYYHPGA